MQRALFGLMACILLLGFRTVNEPENSLQCGRAFLYQSEAFALNETIELCFDTAGIPLRYRAEINMPVCDDTLCSNVVLLFYWDLAGHYAGFDTIPGKPLSKFDHQKFAAEDYQKMDQILKDRNSMLRILQKEDLIDKTVKIKATTVDAVTGATPATIKKAVVEGAVYSSFTLWHFVNGTIRNELAAYTMSHYSDTIMKVLLESRNYETQLFALRQMNDADFRKHAPLILSMLGSSSPLINAYIIAKLPLPFSNQEINEKFISRFPELDGYSKSIFINRIIGEDGLAPSLLPLMTSQIEHLDKKQLDLISASCRKYGMPGYSELFDKMELEQK